MNQTRSLINVNRTAGLFVLLVVIVLVSALALATKAKRLFERDFNLTLILPKEGTFRVKTDDEVHILHMQAGSVTSVEITPDGTIKANLSIYPNFAHFIRRDSVAVIRHGSLLLEKVIVDVTRGQAAPLPASGAQIPCVVEPNLTQTIHDTVRRVAALIEGIQNGKGLLGRIAVDETMANDVTKALSQLDDILASVKTMIDQTRTLVRTTTKLGDNLLETADETHRVVTSLPPLLNATGSALAQVEKTLKDMQKTMSTFRQVGKTVQDDASMLPALLLQAQSLFLELETLVRSIENTWLLRGNVPQAKPLSRIPANSVQP